VESENAGLGLASNDDGPALSSLITGDPAGLVTATTDARGLEPFDFGNASVLPGQDDVFVVVGVGEGDGGSGGGGSGGGGSGGGAMAGGRGLHSSTFQLNLSRF